MDLNQKSYSLLLHLKQKMLKKGQGLLLKSVDPSLLEALESGRENLDVVSTGTQTLVIGGRWSVRQKRTSDDSRPCALVVPPGNATWTEAFTLRGWAVVKPYLKKRSREEIDQAVVLAVLRYRSPPLVSMDDVLRCVITSGSTEMLKPYRVSIQQNCYFDSTAKCVLLVPWQQRLLDVASETEEAVAMRDWLHAAQGWVNTVREEDMSSTRSQAFHALCEGIVEVQERLRNIGSTLQVV